MPTLYFLERGTPTTVLTHTGKPEYVEAQRWKQIAVSEDLGALEAFFKASISAKFKERYRYQIISNAPNFSPICLH